ncbi:biotin/lipoyl-containing protein [Zhongshania aquimaris]|uniref:Lipoyl domain-containing protein n=1 Tax=Zhongshania aquimaris TaxID=2857107 RepID=A0ABS6VVY2_9GAMM|nr:lipoyl domain-containing protein [Zhongshania aquimaris]MBW2942512.1 lipoyl domain-containing protein [Zhongshania aquimaris]
MSTEVRIPSIGFSTQEATLAEWMVADGATVEKGAPLYALELDKSTQEIESPASGTLRIKVEAGEVCEIGSLIAEIV